MRLSTRRGLLCLFSTWMLVACQGAGDSDQEIPRADGPLSLQVRYPGPGADIPAPGRHTVFGSTGNGKVTLSINRVPVRVLSNGAFLAHLPIPGPGSPRYVLVATLGRDTARLVVPVRLRYGDAALAVPEYRLGSSPLIRPKGPLRVRAGETVQVVAAVPEDAEAWVEWGAQGAGVRGGTARESRLALAAVLGSVEPPRPSPTLQLREGNLPASAFRGHPVLVQRRGNDTTRFPLPASRVLEEDSGGWTVTVGTGGDSGRSSRIITGRSGPGGTQRWQFLPGTRVEATGQMDGATRVRIDSQAEVWVDSHEVHPAGESPVVPRGVRGTEIAPGEEWVDLALPMDGPAPATVDASGSRLVLTLYGARAASPRGERSVRDPLLEQVRWTHDGPDRLRYVLHLSRPLYGHRVLWNGTALVLRVRRPPRVDRSSPLQGLTVAVDAGHPPGGAVGPTGLSEPVVTLAVARRLERLLEERGAKVVLTRATPAAVALEDRTAAAVESNAHALVSIHADSRSGDLDPFRTNGTSTYFLHPGSEGLARSVQGRLVQQLGLPDLGAHRRDLALVRPGWMPSVLVEGALLSIPEQEAALRTPGFQEAYARVIAEGLEDFFRALAGPPPG